MNTSTFMRVAAVAAISVFLSLASGCGGGGGDGGGAPAPVIYTGITTQAAITATNAEDLALAALGAGEIGMTTGVITDGQSASSRYLKLLQILGDSTANIELTPSGQPATGASVPIGYSEPGDCGGSVSVTGTLDDQTGDCSGTLTYGNFCSNGSITSGIVSFTGIYNLAADDFDVLTMTTESLSGTSGTDSFTARFNITFDYRPFPNVATMDMVLRDEASGEVYWAENYVMNVWDDPAMTYTDMSITGRSYHPDYGYVDVTTPTVFRIYDVDDNPSQGVLEIVGEVGTEGGNTEAQLIVLSNTQYRVIADIDGDGALDDHDETFAW